MRRADRHGLVERDRRKDTGLRWCNAPEDQHGCKRRDERTPVSVQVSYETYYRSNLT